MNNTVTVDGIKINADRRLIRSGRYTGEVRAFDIVFRFDGYVVPRWQVAGSAIREIEMKLR